MRKIMADAADRLIELFRDYDFVVSDDAPVVEYKTKELPNIRRRTRDDEDEGEDLDVEYEDDDEDGNVIPLAQPVRLSGITRADRAAFQPGVKNAFFRKRWGERIDGIRQNLGLEDLSIASRRKIFDDLCAAKIWTLSQCRVKMPCSGCGRAKDCSMVFKVNGNSFYFGEHCGKLQESCIAFFEEFRQPDATIEELDRLMGEILQNQSDKRKKKT